MNRSLADDSYYNWNTAGHLFALSVPVEQEFFLCRNEKRCVMPRMHRPSIAHSIGMVARNGWAELAYFSAAEEAPLLQAVSYQSERELQAAIAGFCGSHPAEISGINGVDEQSVIAQVPRVIAVPTADLVLAAFGILGAGAALLADKVAVAAGRRPDGRTWVCGDWLPNYARAGSVLEIMLRCANALAEIQDGRSKPSVLRTALPRAANTSTLDEFLAWVDSQAAADTKGTAAVLSALSSAAASNDALAARVVSVIGNDLGRCAAAAIEMLGLERQPLTVHPGRMCAELVQDRYGHYQAHRYYRS